MAIYFYRANEKYGCFSNFSHYSFNLDGKWWFTSEHYFQAKKFYNTKYEEKIRLLDSPMKAAQIGRSRKLKLRKDWEKVKDNIMYVAVYEKFKQNKDIREILINTGNEEIIEKTIDDYYWGCGKNGTGKNMLGNILMKVRKELLFIENNKL